MKFRARAQSRARWWTRIFPRSIGKWKSDAAECRRAGRRHAIVRSPVCASSRDVCFEPPKPRLRHRARRPVPCAIGAMSARSPIERSRERSCRRAGRAARRPVHRPPFDDPVRHVRGRLVAHHTGRAARRESDPAPIVPMDRRTMVVRNTHVRIDTSGRDSWPARANARCGKSAACRHADDTLERW